MRYETLSRNELNMSIISRRVVVKILGLAAAVTVVFATSIFLFQQQSAVDLQSRASRPFLLTQPKLNSPLSLGKLILSSGYVFLIKTIVCLSSVATCSIRVCLIIIIIRFYMYIIIFKTADSTSCEVSLSLLLLLLCYSLLWSGFSCATKPMFSMYMYNY